MAAWAAPGVMSQAYAAKHGRRDMEHHGQCHALLVDLLNGDEAYAVSDFAHGCEFVTCDKDFARFQGLRRRSPLN